MSKKTKSSSPIVASKSTFFMNAMQSETSHTLVATDYKEPQLVCMRGGYMDKLTDDSRNYVVIENHPADSRVKLSEDNICQTLSSRMGTGGGNVPMVMNNIYSIGHDERTAKFTDDEIIDPLTVSDYKDPVKINDPYIVRRLTPLECERLQGFPDGWTDIGDWVDSKGKKHKGDADSPRYRALGNSIALPFWEWMAKRMVKYLDDEPTMASLFDGIGGFPLVYQRAGCEPVWASEIEEFPIAVTKLRFMEE